MSKHFRRHDADFSVEPRRSQPIFGASMEKYAEVRCFDFFSVFRRIILFRIVTFAGGMRGKKERKKGKKIERRNEWKRKRQ